MNSALDIPGYREMIEALAAKIEATEKAERRELAELTMLDVPRVEE
jgi:hypothetical protein